MSQPESHPFLLLIDGELVEPVSGQYDEITNPATGKRIDLGTVAAA